MRKAQKPTEKPNSYHYHYGHPRVETVGPDDDRRDVHRQDDILRDIAWDLMEDSGWSQSELAEKSGLPQSTFNAALRGQRGMGIEFLTGLCAAVDSDPIEVLTQHPLYADHARSVVRPKDRLFQRFQRALRNREANRLLQIVERAKKEKRLERVLRTMAEMVGLGEDEQSAAGDAGNSKRKSADVHAIQK